MTHNSVQSHSKKHVGNDLIRDIRKEEEISKQQTERYLLVTLIASLLVLIGMLTYVINEYFIIKNASSEYLQKHYQFGFHQPFYKESAEAYQKFVLRFITIYGLIGFLGILSIMLRTTWLYLLIIVMTFISVVYFFLL